MTSDQFVQSHLNAVVAPQNIAVEDHIKVALIVNDGSNTPSGPIFPAYLHRHGGRSVPGAQFIWSCSFPRLGVGAESRPPRVGTTNLPSKFIPTAGKCKPFARIGCARPLSLSGGWHDKKRLS